MLIVDLICSNWQFKILGWKNYESLRAYFSRDRFNRRSGGLFGARSSL
jgi:hypothetical protein